MLNELRKLAEELGLVVLGIRHLNKKNDLSAKQRVAGARGWVSFARLNFVLGKTDEGVRCLSSLKVNIAKDSALNFEVEECPVTADNLTVKTIRINWVGKGEATADDLVITAPVKNARFAGSMAEGWLRARLADGKEHASDQVKTEAWEQTGISEDKLLRAAKRVGVKFGRTGMPAHGVWSLPKGLDLDGVEFPAAGGVQ